MKMLAIFDLFTDLSITRVDVLSKYHRRTQEKQQERAKQKIYN